MSMNAWGITHWSERAQIKKDWSWEFLALANDVPKHQDHVIVHATIYFKERRKRDIDNFAAVLWKLTNDALVDAHIIPDDTPEHVTNGIVDLVVDKEKGGTTELRFEVFEKEELC
jgi:Holliday junction resolvase RusA-like endonuclease